jgi:TIR domain
VEVTPPLKYRAFLSYSHRDKAWAKWLHGALETYRLDKDLIGRETSVGLVPKSLRPIFRDREDFSGGRSLTEATITALDALAALIVLCSPVSAGRPAVNEETRWRRDKVQGLLAGLKKQARPSGTGSYTGPAV